MHLVKFEEYLKTGTIMRKYFGYFLATVVMLCGAVVFAIPTHAMTVEALTTGTIVNGNMPATNAQYALSATTNTTDVISVGAEGLYNYRIFKQGGADFSFGNQIVKDISGTNIGMTIVSSKDIGDLKPSLVAEYILKEHTGRYDTIVVVVDGQEKDTITVVSEIKGYADSLISIVGDTVDDAGEAFLGNTGEIITKYVEYGGSATGVSAQIYKDTLLENVDSIVEKIEKSDSNVFLDEGTNLEYSREISEKLEPVSVQVAVINNDDGSHDTLSGDSLAHVVRDNVEYDNVILVVTKDGYEETYVNSSSSSDQKKIHEILSSDTGNTSTGAHILATSDSIVDALTPANYSTPITVGVISFVLLSSVFITASTVRFKRSQARMAKKKREQYLAKEEEKRGQLPNPVYEIITEIEKQIEVINPLDPNLGKTLKQFIVNVKDLFEIAKTSEIPLSVSSRMEVEYTDRLQKISTLIGEKYFISISKKPKYWTNPAKRLRNIKLAVETMSTLTIHDIRQINDHGDIDFNVAIKSLMANDLNNTEVSEVFNATSSPVVETPKQPTKNSLKRKYWS